MSAQEIAALPVLAAGVYLAIGVVFAIPFVLRGAGRIDPQASGGTWGFRVLILPASAALWPWLAWRWLRGAGPPEERTAHRQRAASKGRG